MGKVQTARSRKLGIAQKKWLWGSSVGINAVSESDRDHRVSGSTPNAPSDVLRDIVEFVLYVARLGETDHHGWWGTRSFGAAGRVVLKSHQWVQLIRKSDFYYLDLAETGRAIKHRFELGEHPTRCP